MKSASSISFALAAMAVVPTLAAAQTTKWVIDPVYESISLVCNNSIIEAKSADATAFYTLGGEKIFETSGAAAADAEGNIILKDKDSGMIVGFVNADGKKIDMPAVKPVGEAAFVDGLLMYDNDGAYGTVDTEGNRHEMPKGVIRAFPYSHGYALYQAYAQPEKKKDPYYAYSSLGSEVDYSIDGKKIKRDDIKFLSSVAPDGRAIAVIGDKVYWFEADGGAFTPMLIEGQQPSLTERTLNDLKSFGESGVYTFRGHLEPKRSVTICFTETFVPDKIVSGDMCMEFKASASTDKKEQAPEADKALPASNFSLAQVDSTHYVLKYKDATVPTGKFEAFGSMFGDYAAVKEAGKWGILTFVPAVNYDFVLRGANDEDNIAFRHAKAKAELIVDLPAGISASEFSVSVPDSVADLMAIDDFDRTEKTAGGITRVTYPVTLSIPPTITDQVSEINYPIDVLISGEKQSSQNVKANAWYVKNYIMTIDADPKNALDAYGNVQFVVNVEKDQPDGADYPINVQIVPESPMSQISWNSSKITETKYQFKVANLMPGTNRVWIVMNEEGCPTINMPFELENTGASAKHQAAVEPQPAQQQYQQAAPAQQPMQQVQYQQAAQPQQYQQAAPAQQPMQQVQYQQAAQPQQYQQAAPAQQPMQQVQYQQPAQQQYQQAAPAQQPMQQVQYQQPAQQQYQQAAPAQQPMQQQYQQPQQYQYQQAQVLRF